MKMNTFVHQLRKAEIDFYGVHSGRINLNDPDVKIVIDGYTFEVNSVEMVEGEILIYTLVN